MQPTYKDAQCFGVVCSVPDDDGRPVAKFYQVGIHRNPEEAAGKARKIAYYMSLTGRAGAKYRAARLSLEGMAFLGPVHHGQITEDYV